LAHHIKKSDVDIANFTKGKEKKIRLAPEEPDQGGLHLEEK
jgi:hypothetical protein|tara:strand:- start:41 stop:163 length:123 start_codon:yes stop_codon:yes gene_type:complete